MNRADITVVFPRSTFLLNETMFPPLGIMCLSAFLKQKGLTVQCLDMALGHTPDMAEADTIGIGFTTPQRNEAFALATYFKERGKTLIAGGVHPTHMPEECLEHGFDHIVPGYAEEELYSLLTGHTIDPVAVDALPFPDRECLPIREYYQEICGRQSAVLITSRGCPYNCSFCSKISRKFMMRSAEKTIEEILDLKYQYGFDAMTIYDDTIAVSVPRLRTISEEIRKHDLKFRCFCRSNLLTDEVCELLSQMGVDAVGVGIESGSDEILAFNMKGTTRAMNTAAVHNLQKVGISAKAFLIVGLPGESEETVMQTASWIEEARPNDIAVSVFQPLPGSNIFAHPEKWGVNLSYNGRAMWYRGTPGQYEASVATEKLTTEAIVWFRDWLEKQYKDPRLLQ